MVIPTASSLNPGHIPISSASANTTKVPAPGQLRGVADGGHVPATVLQRHGGGLTVEPHEGGFLVDKDDRVRPSAVGIPGVPQQSRCRLPLDSILSEIAGLGDATRELKERTLGEQLRRAASLGDKEEVVKLLQEGANVNQADENGYTAIQVASCEGHTEVVKALIKSKANIDHQDDQHGNTALHEAAWKGYSQTTEALVRTKGNVYIKNRGGFAPLHLACQNGHNQTCRVLLLAGCNPDIKNNYGDTALHTSGRYGHAGVTRILLSGRCTVGETNKNGDTALHIAVAMGRRKLTKILLEAAADQTLKNKQNESPREIAVRKEYDQILEILRNPPPIVTAEERLKFENEQKKKEKEEQQMKNNKEKKLEHKENVKKNVKGFKGEKKREKTTGSGTSSKDSNNKLKEKKKHKSIHGVGGRQSPGRQVGWSPYGCQYYPHDCEIVDPDIDSLPQEPLRTGEQYFIDLAGAIRKGPVGVNRNCGCAPFFQHVEHKLEADKVALMDHIDNAHGKLDAKITNLENKTRSHIKHLSNTVKQKLAAEKEECYQRSDRSRTSLEAGSGSRSTQLQGWVENQLIPGDSLKVPLQQSTYASRKTGRSRDPLTGLFPLIRSRSEEAISDIREPYALQREPVYKGLCVLDHPMSMYNIPKTIQEQTSSIIYDSPKTFTLTKHQANNHSSRSTPNEPSRSQSADSRSKSVEGYNQIQDGGKFVDYSHQGKYDLNIERNWILNRQSILIDSTGSETSASYQRQSVSSSSRNISPMITSITNLQKFKSNESRLHEDMNLNQSTLSAELEIKYPNSDNYSMNMSPIQDSEEKEMVPKIRKASVGIHEEEYKINDSANDQHGLSTYSRYEHKHSNPYMHGDLRMSNTRSRPQPICETPEPDYKSDYNRFSQLLEETGYEQNQNPLNKNGISNNYTKQFVDDSYLDTDRYKIQQAVRRLYDGYLADGRIEPLRGRQLLETSTEQDSHNDSGYSTRLCSASQGTSPALSGPYEPSHINSNINQTTMPVKPQTPQLQPISYSGRYPTANGKNTPTELPSTMLYKGAGVGETVQYSGGYPTANGKNTPTELPSTMLYRGAGVGETGQYSGQTNFKPSQSVRFSPIAVDDSSNSVFIGESSLV